MTEVYVVWDREQDYDNREPIAAAATPEIAEAIAKLSYGWVTETVEIIESLDDVASVDIHTSAGSRYRGLWTIQHQSWSTWKARVKVGECDLEPVVRPDPGIPRWYIRVSGTNEGVVRTTFLEEALKIEAEYGHDRLRTQVEELDPGERF